MRKVLPNPIQRLEKSDFKNIIRLAHTLGEEGLIFFDLETSGLSPLIHEVIEVSAIKIKNDGSFEIFDSLIRPEKKLLQSNIDIHGITNEDLANAPDLVGVLESFWKFSENMGLVAYNAQFDAGFLTIESKRCEVKTSFSKVYDAFGFSKKLIKSKLIEVENFKLSTLAKTMGFEDQFHRALIDSYACLFVLDKLLADFNGSISSFYLYSLSKSLIVDQDLRIKFPAIFQAIESDFKLNISYKGGSKGMALRPVQPVALIPLPKGLGLYGICLKDNLPKMFWFTKIKEAKLLI